MAAFVVRSSSRSLRVCLLYSAFAHIICELSRNKYPARPLDYRTNTIVSGETSVLPEGISDRRASSKLDVCRIAFCLYQQRYEA